MKFFLTLPLLISLFVCPAQSKLYKEQYRPQFHFTPEKNWINDPNGLVYYKGQYHLFYQYNPFGNVWGHMSWGHAISKDLIHWKHLPVAIPEENGIMIFSGTCVADIKNTSGFGRNGQVPLVAVYTGHIEGVNQSQHIAYSLDDGHTWTKYDKNPVLDLHKKDFRDPKIFWCALKNYWVMAVMLPVEHIVQFYSSKNLKDWNLLSEFGPAGDTSGVWECPDLTQVPIETMPGKKKWLLQMSMNGTMQYFVGEFDGVKFANESAADKIYRPDYGPDYYAAICYGQLPVNHKPISIGWINNWNYANDIPTTPWKGAMSIPRTLSVKKVNGEWLLVQKPIGVITAQRSNPSSQKNIIVNNSKRLPLKSQQFEMKFTISATNSTYAGVRISVNDNTYFEIGYDGLNNRVYADRSKTPNRNFNKAFNEMITYAERILPEKKSTIQFHIFYDHSIVEIFVNDGDAVFTFQLFPLEKDNGVELFSKNDATNFHSVDLWQLKSIW